MMTCKLYDSDAYIRCFEATVIDCVSCENGYKIILDRTAFFPEGGGQSADTGTLGEAKVTDVQEENGEIFHYTDSPLEKGSTVTGKLDWERRFDFMQNHTGEHIVVGLIHNKFGYDNVGFHLGEQLVTFDVNGALSDEDIAGIELEANRVVTADHTVTVSFPTAEELGRLEYRSKLELTENVRIVTIGDVDCCACCAPHVAHTGEVGLIKIINYYPHRGGMRIEMLSGLRAFEDYNAKHLSNLEIMKLLAAPSDQTADAVARLLEKAAAQAAEIKSLKGQLALKSLETEKIGDVLFAYLPEASFDELIGCVNHLTENDGGICLAVSDDGDGSLFVLTAKDEDTQPFLNRIRSELKAKGGGRNNFAQGKIPCTSAEIREFIGK